MPLDLKKIRRWVESCGSAADAARQLGWGEPNLHRLLRGDRPGISLPTLEHLADVMGCGVEELVRRATHRGRGHE